MSISQKDEFLCLAGSYELQAAYSLISTIIPSMANAETLDELDTISLPALVSMAVRIGKTRLIDNVVVE